MVCHSCGSNRYLRSHLRVADLVRLLVLKYPVRCQHCNKRNFAYIFEFLFNWKALALASSVNSSRHRSGSRNSTSQQRTRQA
jgi:ribosomal protein L33